MARQSALPWLALVACLISSCVDGGSGIVPMDTGGDQGWADGDGYDGGAVLQDLTTEPRELLDDLDEALPDALDVLEDADDVLADMEDASLDVSDLFDLAEDLEDGLETMDGSGDLPDIPEELPPCTEWFPDEDGDGWGAGVPACLLTPEGVFTSQDPGDCDDEDPDIYPGAEELCNGLDDDCDDVIDPVHVCPDVAYYCDNDSDGVVAHEASGICSTFACVPETCTPIAGGDCDDGNPTVYLAAPELCNGADEDCDGFIDEDGACPLVTYYCDGDGDGALSAAASGQCDFVQCLPQGCQEVPGEDCDDQAPWINPWTPELCNGIDDDCSGGVDEDGVCPQIPYYCDQDSDGAIATEISGICEAFACIPAGCLGAPGGDCDDGEGGIHPGAAELCNGLDDDCAAGPDDNDICPVLDYYCDDDGDDAFSAEVSGVCDSFGCVPSDCQVSVGTDCDDTDGDVGPAADELCNGADDNCDGVVDEDGVCPVLAFYCDGDQDGALSLVASGSCDTFECLPDGCLGVPGEDCDDGAPAIHPGALELCNGLDDDCLAGPDDGGICPSIDYHCDGDGDGVRAAAVSGSCAAFLCIPQGCQEVPGGDCDDADLMVFPGAAELCNGKDDDCSGGVDQGGVCPVVNFYCDLDGDGHVAALKTGSCEAFACLPESCQPTPGDDCDDGLPEVHPGHPELCNGQDDDCSGVVDDGETCPVTPYFCDLDEDGWPSSSVTGTCAAFGCVPAACQLEPGQDCNDNQIGIHPGAAELCNGKDDDCEGGPDDGGVCPAQPYYCDQDGDGHVALGASETCVGYACIPAECQATPGDDCDDLAAGIHPDAQELCNGKDDDCDGGGDPPGVCPTLTYFCDQDQDDVLSLAPSGTCAAYQCVPADCQLTPGGDCNDFNLSVHPGAAEDCLTSADDDCDGDTNPADGLHCTPYFPDPDGDGYAADDATGVCLCVPTPAFPAPEKGDCGEGDPLVHPGALEICNTLDDNCDGALNEGGICAVITYFCDDDADHHVSASVSGTCEIPGCVPVSCQTGPGDDCDDALPGVHPGATEDCGTDFDDDCDGALDALNAEGCVLFHLDHDGDSFGAPTDMICRCEPAGDYTVAPALATDCNDLNPLVHPDAAEVCDGVDQSCDGEIDEGGVCPAIDYHCDQDQDGAIAAAVSGSCASFQCLPPGCQIEAGPDCNDGKATVYPGADELCNGADDDCSGVADEGNVCPTILFHCDQDGDGAAADVPTGACASFQCLPEGCQVAAGDDCNDNQAGIHPGATEVCNGTDDDCNGVSDDPGVCPVVPYFCDADDDGYAAALVTGQCDTYLCVPTLCQTNPGDDCDETDSAIHPGATEVCNGIDDDCDGAADGPGICPTITTYCDGDGDGFRSVVPSGSCDTFACVPGACQTGPGTDCDDEDPEVHPGVVEVCDGLDEDCSGAPDEDACPTLTYYCDGDGDLEVSAAVSGTCADFECVPEGCQETPGTDCDDDDPDIHTGASEVCDGVDQNCNGAVDESACPLVFYYCDGDGDDHAGKTPGGFCFSFQCIPEQCQGFPGDDCKDGDPEIHPGAPESCDGLDQNCNGVVDEDGACVLVSYFCDGDADGYPGTDPSGSCDTFGCVPPGCQLNPGVDCDDQSPEIRPDAPELCNGVDDDCDDLVDENGTCPVTSYYCDDDDDGAISKTASGTCGTFECIPDGCQGIPGGDCDDSDDGIGPSVTEDCGTTWDDNCNGLLNEDDALGCDLFLLDADGDGYGEDGGSSRCLCLAIAPYDSFLTGDCDDESQDLHPGAADAQCDGVDDNCDDVADDEACWIDAACVPPTTPHPEIPCLHCDPAVDPGAWSDADGASCDDGVAATVDDLCAGGTCAGVPAPCFADDPFDDATRTQTMLLGTDGSPGSALDVDFNPATCAPAGTFLDGTPKCSGGVDNGLSVIAELLNVQIAEQLDAGDIHLLVEFRDWTDDGTPFSMGFYSGEIAAPPCDHTQPGCSYQISLDYLTEDCGPKTGFFNAQIVGTTLTGGSTPGDEHQFTLTMPFAEGVVINLVLHWARIEGTVTFTDGVAAAFEGLLGGAIVKTDLLDALENLPDQFFDSFGFSKEGIIGLFDLLLTSDIDVDGDGIKEAVSIGLLLETDAADIVGVF